MLRAEIKKALSYLDIQIKEKDFIFVFHHTLTPFKFYSKNYSKINSTQNIIYTHKYGGWKLPQSEIKKIKSPVWVLTNPSGTRIDSLEEQFLKYNFKIVDKKHHYGVCLFKAIPVN